MHAAVRIFLPQIYAAGVRLNPAIKDLVIQNLRALGYGDCLVRPPEPTGPAVAPQ